MRKTELTYELVDRAVALKKDGLSNDDIIKALDQQTGGQQAAHAITYFDFDSTGYIKTATEVSSDNSALMRYIARHEHILEVSLALIMLLNRLPTKQDG